MTESHAGVTFSDRTQLKMKSADFIKGLEIMYPDRIKWADVQSRINAMIKEVFRAASAYVPLAQFLFVFTTTLKLQS